MLEEKDERLVGISHYCREVNIELYGGNDVVEAFNKIWALTFHFNFSSVSFTCNGRKVTIEEIKVNSQF